MTSRTRSNTVRARSAIESAVNPVFEKLESRRLMAAFTVVNTLDAGPGSLRESINLSNATPGFDTIDFAIPGAAPHTIQPLTPLPVVTDPVRIDATTQPGYAGAPVVELNGAVAGGNGLHVAAGASHVRGLCVNDFGIGVLLERHGNNVVQRNYIGTDISGTAARGNRVGVLVLDCGQNLVGGSLQGEFNVISGNSEGVQIAGTFALANRVLGNFIGTDVGGRKPLGNIVGVRIFRAAAGNQVGAPFRGQGNIISANRTGVLISATRNMVQANFIGTDVTGRQAMGNSVGVLVDGNTTTGVTANLIGGATRGAGNVISANGAGVTITGRFAQRNFVHGNLVGTDVTGTLPLGNSIHGVAVTSLASSNVVGGALAGQRNVISANREIGVDLTRNAFRNQVLGNFIGTDVAGKPLGNGNVGVRVIAAQRNAIGGLGAGMGNHVAYNGAEGVAVYSGVSNSILSNSIHDNGKLGIDLNVDGPSPNDFLDVDAGGNNTQNFPELGSALTIGLSTTISGKLHSTPGREFLIQVFSNTAADPSGFGEGETLLGTVSAITNAAGDAVFSLTVAALPAGTIISSTATDRLTMDTSEFSKVIGVRRLPIFPLPVDPLPLPIDPIVVRPLVAKEMEMEVLA